MPTDHVQALERFSQAKAYWSEIREECSKDLRYRTGDQWDHGVKSDRENDERYPRPALTFNEMHVLVQNTTNQARKMRPQPKVGPGDGGDPETADFLEGRLRHIFYASQADVAFDHGVEYGASCGFGIYRIVKSYVSNKGFRVEPRVERILDPLSALYVDPNVKLADWSDAEWWFVRERIRRDQFKAKFGKDPASLDAEADADWGDDEEYVWIAEYWHVETTKRKRVQLLSGAEGFDDEIQASDEDPELSSRDVEDRQVICSLIDGEKVLEDTPWEGYWIPLIPVLGQELVVDGKRQLISLIRYSREPQKMLNAVGSNMMAAISRADGGHYLAQAGTIKHRNWTDSKQHLWYEWEPINAAGQPAEAPQWQDTMPGTSIQALTQSWLSMQDQVKRSVGYQDNVQQMAKTPLSGVAVDRRDEQQGTINYHFEDNLVRSQWHCARVLVDLEMQWNDIPRVLQTREPSGKSQFKPVAVMRDGAPQYLDGYDPQEHIVYDPEAEYHVVVESGQLSYAAKIDEEKQMLLQVMQANPNMMPIWLDKYFDLCGYTDLKDRAALAVPPQIQQAEQTKQQGISPREQQLRAQVQQLQGLLQQVGQKLATKQVEQQGRLVVEQTKQRGEITRDKLKLIGTLMENHQQNAHEHHLAMADHHIDAIQHLLDFVKEVELAPDPNAPPQPTGAAA